MAQFDESKVINVLHPEKAEVGEKYQFADNIARLKFHVEHGCTGTVGELKAIENDLFRIGHAGYYLLYPYEELPNKRMSSRQLAEWIAKGNGEFSRVSCDRVYTDYFYPKCEEDNEVDSSLRIRSWDSEEWVEPTVDIYERDCMGDEE